MSDPKLAEALREVRDLVEDCLDYDTPILHQIVNILSRKEVQDAMNVTKVRVADVLPGMTIRSFGGYLQRVVAVSEDKAVGGGVEMRTLHLIDKYDRVREAPHLVGETVEVVPFA